MRIKNKIKQVLFRSGLWYKLDFIRKLPAIIRWLKSGSINFAPHPLKMNAISYYLKKYSISEFVETGTYLGDTLGYIAKTGTRCISIELSKKLFQKASIRFKTFENVNLVYGDSGQIIPELLKNINNPVLFWLDGHYSAGITASAESHTPISIELNSILNHPIKQHVILIDDAHCFNGRNGYPYLDDLLRVIREDGNYTFEVSMDIVRLTPCAV